MSSFDAKFSELQAKISGVIAMLVNEYPEAAVRAREVIEGAVAEAEVDSTVQADEARANAIAALITGAGQVLAQVAPVEAVVELPVDEVVVEPEVVEPDPVVEPEV